MNYLEYRKFGHISSLWRLRCGPSKETIQTQQQLTQSQIGQANLQNSLALQSQANAQADREAKEKLQAPLIAKETALASGDSREILKASFPTISKISQGFESAKQGIMNNVPPGPARDKALADLEARKSAGIFGTQAELANEAPGILANIGSSEGAFSLQELGAALSGFSGATNAFGGASSSNTSVANMQTAASQAFWAPILSLAGIAGSVATGGLMPGGAFAGIFSSKAKGPTSSSTGFGGTFN